MSYMKEKENVTSEINIKLNESKTRQQGLKMLFENLPYISNEILLQYTNLWLSKAIQELENINNDINYLNNICITIGALIKSAKKIPELNKIISMQYVKQMINIIANFELNRQSGGSFYLTAVLLDYYPEACQRLEEVIKKLIISTIDSDKINLVKCGAKCYTYLSNIPQTNFKPPLNVPSYNKYMFNEYLLCNTLHLIMDEVFSESNERNDNHKLDTLDLPIISEDNVVEYFKCLERRIANLCQFLSTMLRTRIRKASVSVSDILNVLIKFFELIHQNENNKSIRFKHLKQMLFKLHISFSSILEAFIIGFSTDLLSIAIPILQLILQSLSWTGSMLDKETNINDYKLIINNRMVTYICLSTWLNMCGPSSAIESIAEKLLPCILKDIIPEKNCISLGAQNKQHMTKKALKKFKTRYQDHVPKYEFHNQQYLKEYSSTDFDLCKEALIVLQNIINRGNYFLKAKFYEKIEAEIILILYKIYTGSKDYSFYKLNNNCRFEILRTLKTILLNSHPTKPLPLASIINICKLASNDPCKEIVKEAEETLSIINDKLQPAAPSYFLPSTIHLSNSLKRDLNSVEGSESYSEKKQKIIPLLDVSESRKILVSEEKEIQIVKNNEELINISLNDNKSNQNSHEVLTKKKNNSVHNVEDKEETEPENNHFNYTNSIEEIDLANKEHANESENDDMESEILTSQESSNNMNSYFTLKEIQIFSSDEFSENEVSITGKDKNDSRKQEEKEEINVSEEDDVLQVFHLFHPEPANSV